MISHQVDDPNGLTVGSGEIVALTAAQLMPRAHRVAVLDKDRQPKGLPEGTVAVTVVEPVQFKSGETILLARGLKAPGNGNPAAAKPPASPKAERKPGKAAIEAAREEGMLAGRKAMLAEVLHYNSVIDAAEKAEAAVEDARAALEAETDEAKRADLQATLDAAIATHLAAEKAADELPELKA